MKRYLLILFLFSFGVVSCRKDDDWTPDDTEQTLFMYMPWSTNLTSYFEQNIADFEKAIQDDILKNNRVIVFFSTSPTEATLFELKYNKGKCIRETIKNYQNVPYTTADGITSILHDVTSFAPARHYAMIISCHGMGWLPVSSPSARSFGQKEYWEHEGVPLTRYFGGLTSKYQTDITTLADGIANAGLKMEYILFDDCYMSTIEVAYDLKDVTNYLIACPTEVMAYGYPYHIIGRHLINNDYYGISNGFYEFYRNYSIMPCGTIGVTDCTELDALAQIMKEINQRFTFDPALLNRVQRMDGYSPVIFFDYGDYVAKLCSDDDLLARFNAQLELTVPSNYKRHTRTYYSMSRGEVEIEAFSGVTISDPSVNPKAASKAETAWYKATH